MNTLARPLWQIWSDSQRLHALVNIPWSRQSMFIGVNITLLALQMPTPFVISSIVNRLSSANNLSVVLPLITMALALMLGALLVGAWLRFEAIRQTLDATVSLRLYLFREIMQSHALGLPVREISELHARFTQDIGAIQNLWPAGRIFALRQILTIVIAVAALFYIDLKLTLTIAIFLPLAIISFRYFGRRLSILAAAAQKKFGESNGVLLESITAAPLAIMSGTDGFHIQRLGESQKKLREALVHSHRSVITMEVCLGALPLIISAIIWIIGGTDVHDGKRTAGELVSFSLVLSILYGPINNLLSLSSGVIIEGASLARLLQLIQEGPTMKKYNVCNSSQINFGMETAASLEIQDLTYARGDECLFNRLSAKFTPGSCVAFRGANGSGKSTLIGLLYGSEPALNSKIIVNGYPLSNLNIATRCELFSFLPQDIILFNDTLRNNILLGRTISDDVITALCERLGLMDFLYLWPQGLDTSIEEGGRNISGGERQRIGLLRTLLVKSPILLLDEPEQNLDAQVLECLIDYLKEIKQFCTCVLITHSEAFDDVIDQTLNLNCIKCD